MFTASREPTGTRTSTGLVAPGDVQTIAAPGRFQTARPGRPPYNETTRFRGSFLLPLLGSNQDSPDPESGVLPVTPRGIIARDESRAYFMERTGIEPVTSAMRMQRSPS